MNTDNKLKEAIIYIRISKNSKALNFREENQELENHIQECKKYCEKNNYKVIDTIGTISSATKNNSKRRIDELLLKLKTGYIIVTTELARLGRNSIENNKIFYQIEESKCYVEFTRETHAILNTTSKYSRLVREVFNIVADLELKLISERTIAGIKFAKEKAELENRPYRTIRRVYDTPIRLKFKQKESEIVYWLSKKSSLAQVARNLDVSENTFKKYFYKNRKKFEKLVNDIKK